MNSLEDRLREAYHAAADTVRPETVLPGGVRGLHGDGHPAARPGRRVRSRSPLLVPLAAAVAMVVAVGTVYVLGSQLFGHAPRPEQPPAAPTLYVYGYNYGGGNYTGPLGSSVTPINTATNTPGTPIHIGRALCFSDGGFSENIAITPDGKTAYATTTTFCHTTSCPITVTPINTATNTAGTPIHVRGNPSFLGGQIVITPDGKTAYVTNRSDVTPINTATNTPGRPIHVPTAQYQAVAITP